MKLSTYILHFNDESVDVVPRIVAVQVLLVTLDFLTDELYDAVEVAEYFVVRTWQVLHHIRERVIQLLGRKQWMRVTFINLSFTFCTSQSVTENQNAIALID